MAKLGFSRWLVGLDSSPESLIAASTAQVGGGYSNHSLVPSSFP